MKLYHLLWIIPLAVSAGSFLVIRFFPGRKKEILHCRDCKWFAPGILPPYILAHYGDLWPGLDENQELGSCCFQRFHYESPVLTNCDGFCHRAKKIPPRIDEPERDFYHDSKSL